MILTSIHDGSTKVLHFFFFPSLGAVITQSSKMESQGREKYTTSR